MKRIQVLILTISLVTAMAMAAETNVTSINIVGYTKVNVPPGGQFQLVGLNFESIGTNIYLRLLDVFGTNQLVKSALSSLADRIYVYDPYKSGGAGYNAYYQKPDGNFYLVGGGVTNPALFSGDAFWIQSANNAVATNTVTIMGSVPLSPTIALDHPKDYVLFCNPFSSDLDINGTNVNWVAQGATSGALASLADKVYIWNGTGYDSYWLKTADLKWHWVVGGALGSNAVIRVGQGAWYFAKGAFTNNYVKPYDL